MKCNPPPSNRHCSFRRYSHAAVSSCRSSSVHCVVRCDAVRCCESSVGQYRCGGWNCGELVDLHAPPSSRFVRWLCCRSCAYLLDVKRSSSASDAQCVRVLVTTTKREGTLSLTAIKRNATEQTTGQTSTHTDAHCAHTLLHRDGRRARSSMHALARSP